MKTNLSALHLIGVLAFMGLLAGCAGPPPPRPVEVSLAKSADMTTADFGAYPSNLEALVRQWGQANLKDPDSARYGKISRPRKEVMVEKNKPYFGYSVCANINAKNSLGGYTGEVTVWFMIRDGVVARTKDTRDFLGKMITYDRPINCEDGA